MAETMIDWTPEHEETLAMVADALADFAAPEAERTRHVRDTFEGCDPAVWAQMAELGWLSILLPEEQGGAGLGLRGAATVAQRFGYACFTEPFVATAVCAMQCLLGCPETVLRDTLIADIAAGKMKAALAWQPPGGALHAAETDVNADKTSDGIVLSGSARFVVPHMADVFLVIARADDELVLCAVETGAQGLNVNSEKYADGTFGAAITFDDVRLPENTILATAAEAKTAFGAGLEAGMLAIGAEMVGLIERMIEITKEYLAMREQFGKKIGSFQVLQHRLVDMWIQKELAAAALRTALKVVSDPAAPHDAKRAAISSLKARASHAVQYVGGQAVQLHGAIGFTDEYELGVYVNRGMALSAQGGNAAANRRRYVSLTTIEER